jgi:uncharacterized protein (DUF1499 family)
MAIWLTFGFVFGALFVLMITIRMARVDITQWHIMPEPNASGFHVMPHGVHAVVPIKARQEDVIAAVQDIARHTPRTRVIAGGVSEGKVTFETRLRVFGFPDYTTVATAQSKGQDVLMIHARLRFGRKDFGVNAARVQNWLSQLDAVVLRS